MHIMEHISLGHLSLVHSDITTDRDILLVSADNLMLAEWAACLDSQPFIDAGSVEVVH